jgi:hypothetical protein
MNILKIFRVKSIQILLLLGGIFSVSCTTHFDEINTNKSSVASVGKTELPFLLSQAQSQSALPFWYYQVGENLFSDQYAQYFATNVTYFPSDRLVIRHDWMQWLWTPTYTVVVPQLQSIMEQTESTSAENAVAQIWWVWTFHRLTDHFGPIPYFKAGEALTSVPYDSQELIYDDFFKRLDAAVDVLANHAGEKPFGAGDLVYGTASDPIASWIKFANSLRLRLAVRISNVDESRAQTEAEAAVAGGVMLNSASDDALMQKSKKGSDFNGLAIMSDWNEFRMSASMESVLKGYDDPRLGEYFLPAVNSGTYEGLRNGLTVSQLGDDMNKAGANSHVGTRWTSAGQETPQNIISTAEAYFNRAEGALLGWSMGGTAKEMYELGITNSLKQWGITDNSVISDYIASTATPIAPDDYLSSPAMTDVPVLFGATVDVQREQIATQKWLALFPDGIEAWADFRRSRYLQLYPVANSDNADIPDPSAEIIRRIPFLDVDRLSNKDAVEAAVTTLGGPDKVTTPLWWDTN